MSRGAMTMRATVSRSSVVTVDPDGQPGIPEYVEIGTVPCRAWSDQRREMRTDGENIVVEDLRAIVPATADVAEEDRLEVEDRRGVVLFGGPVAVEASALHGVGQTRHRELMLRRHV